MYEVEDDAGENVKLTTEQKEAMLYSGCYVTVMFKLWTSSNKGNWLGANLEAVKFKKDGDVIGGSSVDVDDMEDEDDDF